MCFAQPAARNFHKSSDHRSGHRRPACLLIPAFAAVVVCAATPLFGQTVLSSGQHVPIALEAMPAPLLRNGANGYRIDVPPDTMRLTATLEMATPGASVDLHPRCGSDVTTSAAGVVSDASGTTTTGMAVAVVSRPLNGSAGSCFAALDPKTLNVPLYGRLIVNAEPFPSGTRIDVPAVSLIGLAGQPAGTSRAGVTGLGSFTTPLNAPVQVPIQLTTGEGLRIRAAGSVGLQYLDGFFSYGPRGTSASVSVPAAQGLSALVGPSQALYGVFLGPTIDTRTAPAELDSRGSIKESMRIAPLVQQFFFVGDGLTPGGEPRVFVVPDGATRLFLGIAAESPQNVGTVTAVVSPASIPDAGPRNPVFVPGTALVSLAGQPTATKKTGSSGLGTFSVPMNSPVEVALPLGTGQTLQVRAVGTIGAQFLNGFHSNGPDGAVSTVNHVTASFGLSGFNRPGRESCRNIPRTYYHAPQHAADAGFQPSWQGGRAYPAVAPATILRGHRAHFEWSAPRHCGFAGSHPAVPWRDCGAIRTTWEASSPPSPPNRPISPRSRQRASSTVPGSVRRRSRLGGPFHLWNELGVEWSPMSVPLPTHLGGTTVYFDTTPAPLFSVSPMRINAQIPTEFQNRKSVMVTVGRDGIPTRDTFGPLSHRSGYIHGRHPTGYRQSRQDSLSNRRPRAAR